MFNVKHASNLYLTLHVRSVKDNFSLLQICMLSIYIHM